MTTEVQAAEVNHSLIVITTQQSGALASSSMGLTQ